MSKASRIVDLSTKIPVIVLTLVPFVLWEISLPSSQGYQLPTEDSRVIVTWEVAAACEQLSSMLFGWKGCIISRDHSGRVNLSLDSLPHPPPWYMDLREGFCQTAVDGHVGEGGSTSSWRGTIWCTMRVAGYEPVVLNCLFPFLFFFCAKFPGLVGSCPVNFLAIGPWSGPLDHFLIFNPPYSPTQKQKVEHIAFALTWPYS